MICMAAAIRGMSSVLMKNGTDDDCSDEVSAATAADDLEEKVIKTVLFKDAVKYYEFGATLPSSPAVQCTSNSLGRR